MKKQNYCFAVLVALALLSVSACRSTTDSEGDTVYYLTTPIVIDGEKEAAWNNAPTVKTEHLVDTKNPGNEFGALSVVNDQDNLYIALDVTDLSDFWAKSRITLIIDKAGVSSGFTGSAQITDTANKPGDIGHLLAADTMTFTNGQADIYFFHLACHNPNRGSGGATTGGSVLYVNGSLLEENWSGTQTKVTAAPYCWDQPDGPSWDIPHDPDFIEYRFALTDLGLANNNVIRVFAVDSAVWSDAINALDVLPEIPAPNAENVTFDFNEALSYTIKIKE